MMLRFGRTGQGGRRFARSRRRLIAGQLLELGLHVVAVVLIVLVQILRVREQIGLLICIEEISGLVA